MISGKKSSVTSLLIALAIAGFGFPAIAEDGAKGLFFEQLESPYKSLNTGVQYYIELHRDGRQTKVTNKYGFKSGDKIKFHIKSNIDGYAYILLKNGSRGEQSVLFPDPDGSDDNKVKRGEDYQIPGVGFLTFDENPGTEKVSLVLSRTPIDAQAYLATPTEAPTLIASAMTGAKDLIPQRVLVHFSEEKPRQIASLPPREKVESKPRVTTPPKKPAVDKPVVATNGNGKKPAVIPVSNTSGNSPAPSKKSKMEPLEGTVTVVSEVPGNVLHVDVDLHHI